MMGMGVTTVRIYKPDLKGGEWRIVRKTMTADGVVVTVTSDTDPKSGLLRSRDDAASRTELMRTIKEVRKAGKSL